MEIKIPEPIKFILGEIILLEQDFDNPDKKDIVKINTNKLFSNVQANSEKLNKLIENLVESEKLNSAQIDTYAWLTYFSNRTHFKNLLSSAHVIGKYIRNNSTELSIKFPYMIIEMSDPIRINSDETQGDTLLLSTGCVGLDTNGIEQLLNSVFLPGQEFSKLDKSTWFNNEYKDILSAFQEIRKVFVRPNISAVLPSEKKIEIHSGPQVIDISLGYQRNDPRKEVFWAPLNKDKKSLGNMHAIVFGQSGFGKTNIIKVIMKELSRPKLAENSVPCMFFDFHGELTGKDEKHFVDDIGAKILDPSAGLPINPLYIPRDPDTGKRYSFLFISSQVSQTIGSVFELTPIQITILETAIESVYLQNGFVKEDPKTWDKPAPEFNKVWDALQAMASEETNNSIQFAVTRLKPLFINNIFRGKNEGIDMVFAGPTIVRLNALPNIYLRTALVNFFLVQLYETMLSKGPTKSIRLAVIIDECKRVSNVPVFKELFREARKFGLSLVNASQRLNDFPEDVISNSGTIIGFKMMATDANRFSKELGSKNRSKLTFLLQQLEVGEAVIRNSQNMPFTVFKTKKAS